MRAKTRSAVYFGDRFRQIADALGVGVVNFTTSQIISSATFSKLRRRYNGMPVEQATRDKIVEFLLKENANQKNRREEISQQDIQNCLLPATWRLNEQGRLAIGQLERISVKSPDFVRDRISRKNLAILFAGGFAVYKHIEPVAKYLASKAPEIRGLPEDAKADDLIEDWSDDHNLCYPAIYENGRRGKNIQLSLLGESPQLMLLKGGLS
ncbi:MAG: hypothetical protein Q7S99_04625 [Parvibaculum sp.]|nr:hypothetical protein [Parvibaculum sp.]